MKIKQFLDEFISKEEPIYPNTIELLYSGDDFIEFEYKLPIKDNVTILQFVKNLHRQGTNFSIKRLPNNLYVAGLDDSESLFIFIFTKSEILHVSMYTSQIWCSDTLDIEMFTEKPLKDVIIHMYQDDVGGIIKFRYKGKKYLTEIEESE